MTKRFGLLLLTYLVPTFLLGFFWHLKFFAAQYHALEIYRADVIIPLGLGSMLIQGWVIAWTYPRLMQRTGSLTSGLKFAAAAALLSWSFTTLAVAAKNRMLSVPDYVLIESGFTAVQFLLVGPLLALASRGREQAG